MRKGNLTKKQAIEAAGMETVLKLEAMDCDFTNRVQTDGDNAVEFAASEDFTDSEGVRRTLTVYYYQNPDDLEKADDLGKLKWSIEGYEIS